MEKTPHTLEEIKRMLQPAIDALAKLGYRSTIMTKDAYLHAEPSEKNEEDHKEKNDRS
jgi:hypothetical protein